MCRGDDISGVRSRSSAAATAQKLGTPGNGARLEPAGAHVGRYALEGGVDARVPQVQQRDVADRIQVRDKLANKRGMLGRAALDVARHRESHGDHRLACKVDGAALDVERDHGPVRRLRCGDDRTRFDCADGP